MITKMTTPKKNPDKYTSKDVYQEWRDFFEKHNDRQYQVHGFLGNELHVLKDKVEQLGIYPVLLALESAAKEGVDSVSAFARRIEYFLPDTHYPKLLYWVPKKGKKEQQEKWRELMVLESKWFPTAEDEKIKNSLAKELEEWIDGII